MKMPSKFGMLLLAIWVLTLSLPVLIPALAFSGLHNVQALLGIAAAILLLIDR